MYQIRVKRLTDTACLPVRATAGSAGYDLYADIPKPWTIHPGETLLIPTGIALEIPDPGYGAFIFARSGLSVRAGICLANGVGVIDSDYRGEIQVAVCNRSQQDYSFSPQERIAQMVFLPVALPLLTDAEDLEETVRGAGGFGSTGRD
ncbi:MAG TPA: dUTP diphosphatase [Firmicutes bacterium]|nr:dUTP diphosphatase [Bacillota bacterium]